MKPIVRYSIIITLIFITSCASLERIGAPARSMKVTITSAVPTDLDQVAIRAQDQDGNPVYFVKSFYWLLGDQRRTRQEARRFARSIASLKDRKVTIRYHRNSAGDRECTEIIYRGRSY